MVFLIELLLQVSTTIGMCSIMYVIANQPITRFTVLVWSLTSAIIRIGFVLYEKYKLNKSIKKIDKIQNKITKDIINEELENKEEN